MTSHKGWFQVINEVQPQVVAVGLCRERKFTKDWNIMSKLPQPLFNARFIKWSKLFQANFTSRGKRFDYTAFNNTY